jgi:hypothetical protein
LVLELWASDVVKDVLLATSANVKEKRCSLHVYSNVRTELAKSDEVHELDRMERVGDRSSVGDEALPKLVQVFWHLAVDRGDRLKGLLADWTIVLDEEILDVKGEVYKLLMSE